MGRESLMAGKNGNNEWGNGERKKKRKNIWGCEKMIMYLLLGKSRIFPGEERFALMGKVGRFYCDLNVLSGK